MTTSGPTDEFYVGYRDDNPDTQSRFTRRLTLLLLVAGIGLGALLASLQGSFDPGVFEFGRLRSIDGTLRIAPQPLLQLDRPLTLPASASRATGETQVREILLVEFGKHGAGGDAAASLQALDGRAVTARGSLIARGRLAMLELAQPPQPRDGVPLGARDSRVATGHVRLTGEIVDSKCFLGVMKPGRGKVHRACATLCLEGGIPPAFLVRDHDGEEWVALLLDADGRAPTRSLALWVGESLTLEGSVHALPGQTTEFHVDLESQLP